MPLNPNNSPYGPLTVKAVKTYQFNKGLPETGAATGTLQMEIKKSHDVNCGATPVAAPTSTPSPTPTFDKTPITTPSAESCVADLPLTQRLGQIIMIGVHADRISASKTLFSDHQLGGAIIMGQVTNSERPAILGLKDFTQLPLLIATDEEGAKSSAFVILADCRLRLK